MDKDTLKARSEKIAENLKASNEKIAETLKAYNKAIDKKTKTKTADDKAKAEVQATKEAYLNALEEAKKAF
jgi:hypothetical protein